MNLEIINVEDITIKFKDELFDKKVSLPYRENEFERICLFKALKNITYLTDLYVYKNTIKVDNYVCTYITQTSDNINNHSIFF